MKRVTLALPAPYVGLRPFNEDDALIFFGRDSHVHDLLVKLEQRQRFVAVVGPSGTGKSSLVRAGLIPALHRGALSSGGHRWNIFIFRPGDAPLLKLATELVSDQRFLGSPDWETAIQSLSAQLATSPLALCQLFQDNREVFKDESILLVVDQFEEIFRYRQKNIDEAEAFVKLLLRSASEPDVPIYVVITMRTDFLGNCIAFDGLPEAINNGLYLTPRLNRDQLASVIESPLRLTGGEIDESLVAKLINTLGGEDELPVLEHALLRMWNQARSHGRTRLEEADFSAVCSRRQDAAVGIASHEGPRNEPRISYAIDHHASEIYQRLTPQQGIARRLFLCLSERSEGQEIRRPQSFNELQKVIGAEQREGLLKVIDAFRAEGAGFLQPPPAEAIADHTVIDITHESLIRQWQEFQTWLAEEQQDITELKEWRERAARRLSGGGFLDENDHARAQKWRERVVARASNPGLWAQRYASGAPVGFEEVQRFISDSEAKLKADRAERERLEQGAREAKIRQLEFEKLQLEHKVQLEATQKAEEDKRNAEAFAQASRRKTLMALAALCVTVLALIGVFFFAYRAEQEKQHAKAEQARAERLAQVAVLRGLLAKAQSLESSQPGSSILLSLFARRITPLPEVDGFIHYLKTQFNFQRVFRGHERGVASASFSPDGKTVVTACRDRTARLWEVATGKALQVLRGHEREVGSASFSPDGKRLVTASWDNTARLWRCDICRPIEEIVQELKTAVGRHFTADECQRFGISDELLRSAGLSKDEYCVDSSKSTGEGFELGE